MYTERVQQFTQACAKKKLPFGPTVMNAEAKAFIKKMVLDEMAELMAAKTVVDQADALVDAIYYLCDVAVRHGMHLDPLFEIVHHANMQKVVHGKVLRRADGKIMKPPQWKDPKPLLEAEIRRQQQEGAFSDT